MHKSDRILLRPIEVAEALQLSRSRAYQMIRQGELPVVRIGSKSVRVPAEALRAWVEERTTQVDTDNQP